MRTLSQHGRAALVTIWRYGFFRVKGEELKLLSAQRELSALRSDYLELGFRASTLASERDMAIAARKKTEAYIASIRSDREFEGESGTSAPGDHRRGGDIQQPATPGILTDSRQSENTSPAKYWGEADVKQHAMWNAFDTLKEYVTPRLLLLEAEMSSVQRELANLGDDYLELAERANTITCERYTAFLKLNEVQVIAESLESDIAVDDKNEDQTIDPIFNDSINGLTAVSEKLHKTQAEKNDLGIKLAESEDRVAELRRHEMQLYKNLDTLNQRLFGRDKESTAALWKAQQLTGELEKARIAGDEKNQLLADTLHKVRDEYAEARHNDRQHIEGLERCVAELGSSLAAANRTIEDLRQSLADATYRQKFMDKHASLLASELDEGLTRQKESLNTVQHRMKTVCTETAMADRHASRTSWKSIAAGFVLLLGVVASMEKFWVTDPRVIHRAGADKEVDMGNGEQYNADQHDTVQASPSLPETIELSSLDTVKVHPAKVENESGDEEMAGKEQASALQLEASAIDNMSNMGKKRKRTTSRGKEGMVRVYLMGVNDDIDISSDTCVQSGHDTKGCQFLEKNMFEEGVIRLPSGVQYTVIRNGTGASPRIDDIVRVKLRGALLDGTEFDSPRGHGDMTSFRVDEAIPGIQEVLQYMEVGAKWEVYIPSKLAFKKPALFGGQTLVFDLELISIENSQDLSGVPGATWSE